MRMALRFSVVGFKRDIKKSRSVRSLRHLLISLSGFVVKLVKVFDEFNSAFDRAHTRLLEIDCRLPEVAKAWAYLNSLGLSTPRSWLC